ncbi:MAG: isochorismatase family protein, partial [Eubacteriales bacterium]|nr:isochorismatase family protein [Eubacteriales bacterium]
SFSCLDAPGFEEELESMTAKHVVIAGIEAHICVYQTAMDFLDRGFKVTILKDCCGARKKVDFDTAMAELEKAGCRITTFETFVYQTLRTSRHTAFRTISEIVKE